MKFKGTISRITSEGVKAMMDNREYFVSETEWYAVINGRVWNTNHAYIKLGDRIEGDINENNEIVNVKICH